jgi:folate-dependent phosphoribosylglycinamide formyltransferase PurN
LPASRQRAGIDNIRTMCCILFVRDHKSSVKHYSFSPILWYKKHRRGTAKLDDAVAAFLVKEFSMTPELLFDPDKAGRPMRVAAFMSGSGTNIVKLLELERKQKSEHGASPYEVVFIYSDRSDGKCRGESIAREAGIPYFSYDVRRFHELRGAKRTMRTEEGRKLRREYDNVARTLVKTFEIDVIALGGYMSVTTLGRCVNVHPADLSITNEDGTRRFVGDDAVIDAIAAGRTELRASTLWTDQGVDSGPLLMISRPLPVELPLPIEDLQKDPDALRRVAGEHQERLKEAGDWEIFPRTILMIARGRFAMDKSGRVYVDNRKTEHGFRLED